MSQTYQEAIENSNIVSKTDIDGIITFVNEEFCKISGYTKEELIGKNHNIVRHPEVPEENFILLWKTILSKKPFKATVKNLSKDGSTVYLNTTITPILDEDDTIKEFIAIRYDVTEEVTLKKSLEKKDRELEELNKTLEHRVQKQTKQLQELNKTLEERVAKEIEKNKQKQKMLFWQSRMASLGQMLANIAHQWRQPLTELNLALFNMKNALKNRDEEKMQEYYDESKTAIMNMSQTIEDFTNFFNPDKPKEAFLVKTAIQETLVIMRKVIERNNLNITLDLLDLKVLGVSNELSQVLINLIQNANEAFTENDVQKRHIDISMSEDQHKNFVILKIKDNAGGISPQDFDKIFEPYFTTKHSSSGTGLGLFMSKMIIEKSLNGTMTAMNQDNGCLFVIKIPRLN